MTHANEDEPQFTSNHHAVFFCSKLSDRGSEYVLIVSNFPINKHLLNLWLSSIHTDSKIGSQLWYPAAIYGVKHTKCTAPAASKGVCTAQTKLIYSVYTFTNRGILPSVEFFGACGVHSFSFHNGSLLPRLMYAVYYYVNTVTHHVGIGAIKIYGTMTYLNRIFYR